VSLPIGVWITLVPFHHSSLAASVSASHARVCRLLAAYRSRVAAEGEYDEQELPGELVDELEGAAGPAQRAFAVSCSLKTRLECANGVS
jgi:hypothetical protein